MYPLDVKYIPADWEKMRDGIGDLIGLGRWGKGMIDDLKDLSDNLEDVESDIANYDSDGVISFHHTSQKSKYQGLYEDFEVLHSFTGKVGDIVDRRIDHPFYEEIDAFVETMRDATISKYTTKNRIGATETKIVYAGYGQQQSLKVPKTEVGIDDLFTGDNFYAEQMKLQYDEWTELNPDQDFSQKEYQQAVLNSHAFQYESIKDQQENKEFWGQIAALVVIVGVSLVCPPAGMALGVAYGSLELSSAVSGKDWISGRELGTGERWFRGVLAPLDIFPGVNGLSKFSSAVRVTHLGEDLGALGLRTGAKLKGELNQIHNLVKATGEQSIPRLKRAQAAVQDFSKLVKNKVARDTIEAGQLVDNAITGMKSLIPSEKRVMLTSTGHKINIPAENTHAVENSLKDFFSRFEGNNLVGIKGTGNTKHLDDVPRIKEIEVNFKINDKHDSEEFVRQLKDQEKGMNELTVDEYLINRDRYIAEGRAIEGNAAQKMARQEALKDKIAELRKQGLSRADATKQASEWLETKAALHNPDQIAGGRADIIGGMGHKRVNSSIGSLWKYRIDVVDEQIREIAKNMSLEQLKNTYLNVKLTQ